MLHHLDRIDLKSLSGCNSAESHTQVVGEYRVDPKPHVGLSVNGVAHEIDELDPFAYNPCASGWLLVTTAIGWDAFCLHAHQDEPAAGKWSQICGTVDQPRLVAG